MAPPKESSLCSDPSGDSHKVKSKNKIETGVCECIGSPAVVVAVLRHCWGKPQSETNRKQKIETGWFLLCGSRDRDRTCDHLVNSEPLCR